jgi:putative ABC transport system substrate-binding protein
VSGWSRSRSTKNILRAAIIALLFGSTSWAQQSAKMARLGYLTLSSPAANAARRQAFLDGLGRLGYVEGKNIFIEYRYADSRAERLPELAADLVRLKVDAIVAGGTQVNLVAKKSTSKIPIVMLNSDDPLGSGLVQSLARPGGNVTGLSSISAELSGKRLEIFKESFPTMSRIAVIWYSASEPALKETQAVAQALGFKINQREVRSVADLDRAFAAVSKDRPDGFFPVTSAFMSANRKRIVEFAAKIRVPAMYSNQEYVDDGGLMSYAANIFDLHRRAAVYVDKILNGMKPTDIPVEQPMKFEFIVNLNSAKQIDVTIPPTVLMQADRVIR